MTHAKIQPPSKGNHHIQNTSHEQGITNPTIAAVMHYLRLTMTEYNVLQDLQCKIAIDQYKNAKIVAASLQKSTIDEGNARATAMRTEGTTNCIMGASQLAMGGVQTGFNHYKYDSELAPLHTKQQRLTTYREKFQNPGECEAVMSDRSAMPSDQTEAIKQHLSDFQQGKFSEEFQDKHMAAVKMASPEHRQKIIDKIDERLGQLSAKKTGIHANKNALTSISQSATGLVNGVSGGVSKLMQASNTQEQAKQEAIKSLSQTTLSQIDAAGSVRQMGDTQQQALALLQLVQAIQASQSVRG